MVKLERFIDKYLGSALVGVLTLAKYFIKEKPIPKKPKVLIIKLWAIGDSVLSLSLIKAIKRTFPGSEVDVLTRDRVKAVFQSCPEVEDIVSMDDRKRFVGVLLKRRYDIVFDCEPYLNLSAIFSFFLGRTRIGFSDQFRSRLYTTTVRFRKDQHMVQNYIDMIRVFGKQYETDALEPLHVDASSRMRVDRFLKTHNKLLVGISPGVAESAKSRMWYEDRFAKLADNIFEELGAEIVFIDGPSNKKVVQDITSQMKNKALDATGRFSLEETFYLIKKCKVFIGNDSGPMHIAAAQGCRTIGLFGPNTPVLWGPYGKDNIAIYKTKLAPSIQNDKGIFPDVDREGYMGPIKVGDVFDAVKKLIY
jgi:lipopolysaccharide heptosyltransferase II